MLFKIYLSHGVLIAQYHLTIKLEGKVFVISGVKRSARCKEFVSSAAIVDYLCNPVLLLIDKFDKILLDKAVLKRWTLTI